MEKDADKNLEKGIMPGDLFEEFIEARKNTYASGKKPQMGLHLSDSWGHDYHKEGSLYYYQDNYRVEPCKFVGEEKIDFRFEPLETPPLAIYRYHGGLTEKGAEEGEDFVYSRLKIFLKEHAEEVRFGKNVSFSFEDEDGEWIYKGEGEITSMCWEDKEEILHNEKKVYELIGVGICFIEGY